MVENYGKIEHKRQLTLVFYKIFYITSTEAASVNKINPFNGDCP